MYEVTVHSYNVLYDQGRERLRSKDAKDCCIEFQIGQKIVRRPLKVVTYHAKDVYPQLLRSTLLVRLVATYEAFLVDTVEEISRRSPEPFMKNDRVEMSQSQFLSLAKEEEVLRFVVNKKLHQLTSGGLEEIRKWYTTSIGIDILAPGQSLADIQEIHDRRHLYVHRSGYADEQYCRKYQVLGVSEGDLLSVDESYFVSAISVLEVSALHLKQSVESKYPNPPTRTYVKGAVLLPDSPERIQYICIVPKTADGWTTFTKLDLKMPDGGGLNDILVWMSNDGREIRYLVGGTTQQISALIRLIHNAERRGDIEQKTAFKIKRD